MKFTIFKIGIVLSLIIPLHGSNVKKEEQKKIINYIKLEEVFLQNGDYYVLFYLRECLSCKNAIQIINIIANEVKYYFFLVEVNNSLILQKEDGSNIGVCDYNSLSVYKVPTLFFIKNKQVYDEVIGFNNIRYYLELLKKE